MRRYDKPETCATYIELEGFMAASGEKKTYSFKEEITEGSTDTYLSKQVGTGLWEYEEEEE